MTQATSQPEMHLTPHRFSTRDYLRMVDLGVLGPGDRVELIDGIIAEMTPANAPHNFAVKRLNTLLTVALHEVADVVSQGTVRVAEGHVYDPDLAVFPLACRAYEFDLPNVASASLVIEVSDSSLAKDAYDKMPVYARAGVSEYWIVDVAHEQIVVHRTPSEDRYDAITKHGGGEHVSPVAYPKVAIRVGDLFA